MKKLFFFGILVYIVALYCAAQYDASMGRGVYWYCWKYSLIRIGEGGNSGICLSSLMLVIAFITSVNEGWKVDKDVFWTTLSAKGTPIALYLIVTLIAMWLEWTGVPIPIGSNGGDDFWNAGGSVRIDSTQIIQDAHEALPEWAPDWIVPDSIGVPAPANWWFPLVLLGFSSMMLGLLGWSIKGTAKKISGQIAGGFLKKETWKLIGHLILIGIAIGATGYLWWGLGMGAFFGYQPGESSLTGFVIFCITNLVGGWILRWMRKNDFFQSVETDENGVPVKKKKPSHKEKSNNYGPTHTQR